MLALFDPAVGVLPAIVTMLVDVAIKVTVVLCLAYLVAGALRYRSAAVRHAVWNVAIGGVLLLPVLSLAVPGWRVPVPAGWTARLLPQPEMPAAPVVAVSDRAEVTPAVEPPVIGPVPAATPAPVPRISDDAAAIAVTPVDVAPMIVPQPDTGHRGLTWHGWVVGLWWFGASLVLLLLGIGLFKVSRMSAAGRPVSSRAWLDLRDDIAWQLEIRRPVTLVMSERTSTPFTWGARKPVVVLPADAMSWPADRRHQVLVHEMAHVRRNDFLTQLLARYACAAYWFHPLVWLAADRLREAREQACDDAVLGSGARPSTYAGHLLQIARSARDARASAFASVAMARRSQLEGRLVALLDERRTRRDPGGPSTALGWAAAFALLVPLAAMRPALSPAAETPAVSAGHPAAADATPVPRPAPVDDASTPPPVALVFAPQQGEIRWASAPQCSERRGEGESRGTNSNHNDDNITVRWWDGDCEGQVRIRGTVRFTDDFTDVRSLERGGRFEIEIDDGDLMRRVEMRADDGRLNRRWFVDGREAAYDTQSQEWLAAALSDFFRHSGVELEARIDRLLQQGGVEAVLAQARRVHGDYMMGQMFERALASGRMSVAQIDAVIREAAAAIDSDYSLSRVLRAIPAAALADGGLRRTYVQATDRIDSDYEKRQSLQAVLTQPDLSDQVVMDLLQTSRTIDSDYELATLLRELGAQYLRTPALRTAYLETAQSIRSDYELRRVLTALLENQQLENEVLSTLLETSAGIDSDYELAELLVQASTRFVVDDAMRPAFFRAVNTIGSDYERSRVLKTLMDRQSLQQGAVLDLLESASTIGSDYQLAEVLAGAGASYLVDDALRAAFFRALGTVGSDYERQRVVTTVAGRGGLSQTVVLDLVRAAGEINGDYAKAASLIEIQQRYGTDDQVRAAIEEAANGIGSDYEYGRVMSATRGRNTRR